MFFSNVLKRINFYKIIFIIMIVLMKVTLCIIHISRIKKRCIFIINYIIKIYDCNRTISRIYAHAPPCQFLDRAVTVSKSR